MQWEKTKTLAIEPTFFKRKVREALEIRRLKSGPDDPNGLNRDYGDYVTTNSWQILFDKMNQNKRDGRDSVERTKRRHITMTMPSTHDIAVH